MSDFDKEAERKKLREKYERDREKRKETERMSQLLLQGATMTNRHCGTCGDPLFRYEGTEFCATCDGETDVDTGSRPSPDAVSESEQAEERDAERETQTESEIHGSTAESSHSRSEASTSAAQTKETSPRREESAVDAEERTTTSVRAGDGSDLDAARGALIRTITHHAQRAEAADGPRRATDHLAAVREAAEALAALDRDRR